MVSKALTDRLSYYPTRQRWRLRYRNEDGVFGSKLFGPRCKPEDQTAYATAVLELDLWLNKRNEKLDVAAHVEAMKQAESDYNRSGPILKEARRRFKAGEMSKEEAEGELVRAISLDMEGWREMERLKQPQLRLLNRIKELEPLAYRAVELDEENRQLREENDHLRALLAASGRAAATEVGDLSELVEKFLDAHWAKLRSNDRQEKTMQPIRASARKVVEYLAGFETPIMTSADLDATPRALAEYRDSIVSQLADKSSGWARKQLDGPKHFCEWLVARGYLAAMPRSITRDWMSVGVDEPCPTFFSVEELRNLWAVSEGRDRIRVLLIMGMNCAYRERDLVTLKASEIDLSGREIRRVRNKTKRFAEGVPQCHRLWKTTAKVLRPWLDRKHDGYPFADFEGVSSELCSFIDATIPGNATLPYGEKRYAKSLRSTASQMVEDLTEGDAPHLAYQMLGDRDGGVGKHYRKRSFEALYKVIDQMEQVLDLKD